MSGVPVTDCARCGWRGFPARVWCPACGSEKVETVLVTAGTIEALTSVRRAPGRVIAEPIVLATVALAGGGRVVARVEGGSGDVIVDMDGGAPVARGGAPQREEGRGG